MLDFDPTVGLFAEVFMIKFQIFLLIFFISRLNRVVLYRVVIWVLLAVLMIEMDFSRMVQVRQRSWVYLAKVKVVCG